MIVIKPKQKKTRKIIGHRARKSGERSSHESHQRYVSVKSEIEALNNERAEGVRIRKKCTHIELSEQSSKYFFCKEVANAETKSLTTLQLDDGTYTTNNGVILTKQREFYEKLYRQDNQNKESMERETNKFLSAEDLPKLPEDDKNRLDSLVTLQEITKSVNELPNNKSPGSDGLPSEFYKAFWPKISKLVQNSINYGIENETLSPDQRKGVLTLTPKKGKDLRIKKIGDHLVC